MPGGWSTLRHRDFALVCFARFAVTLALHMSNVAIGWYIYDVTGSAFALGFLGIAGIIPVLTLALVTGYVTDRFDRRLILFSSDLVLTVTGLALLSLIAAGYGIVWPVYLIVMVISAARAFHQPASQAIVPALVPADQLPSAIAFSSGVFQSAQIIGPALGGILYAVEAWMPFASAAILYATASLAALAVRHRSTQEAGRMRVTVASLLAGFQYTLSKPVVLGAVSLDMFVVMFGSVVLLLPVFAKDVLHVGPEGLGLLRAAPAIGAIGMAMWLAGNRFVHQHTGKRLFMTILVYGAATAAFGLSNSFIFSLLCLVIVGASDMVSVVIRHTLVQAETPDALRGRVSAVNSLFISSASELGQIRAGGLAEVLGAVPAVVAGGLAAIGLSVIWPRLFPKLAQREHLLETEPASTRAAGADAGS